jgi:hypothetical protein
MLHHLNHGHHHTLKPVSSTQISRILASKLSVPGQPQAPPTYLNNEDSDNIISAISLKNKAAKNSTQLNDLMAEANTAFINSPIRSLTNHHKNQRLIKQFKKQSYVGNAETGTKNDPVLIVNDQPKDALLNIMENKDSNNSNMDESTRLIANSTTVTTIANNSDQYLLGDGAKSLEVQENDTEASKEHEKEKATVRYIEIRRKKIAALVIISVITMASMHLCELFSCFIRKSLNGLLVVKASACLTSFVFVLAMSFSRCVKDDSNSVNSKKMRSKTKCYYNIFCSYYKKNQSELDEDFINDSELQDICIEKKDDSQTAQEKQEEEIKAMFKYVYKTRIKSNFYLILLSLLLINFWTISTYLFGFVFSASVHSSLNLQQQPHHKAKHSPLYLMQDAIELVSSFVGGIGLGLFFKQMVLALFEISSSNRNQLFKKIMKLNARVFGEKKKNNQQDSGEEKEKTESKSDDPESGGLLEETYMNSDLKSEFYFRVFLNA